MLNSPLKIFFPYNRPSFIAINILQPLRILYKMYHKLGRKSTENRQKCKYVPQFTFLRHNSRATKIKFLLYEVAWTNSSSGEGI